MSDKETVLTQLQNHQCSVQDAMLALDYIYAEKARPLLDACERAVNTVKWALEKKQPQPGSLDPCVMSCQDLRDMLTETIDEYKKGV